MLAFGETGMRKFYMCSIRRFLIVLVLAVASFSQTSSAQPFDPRQPLALLIYQLQTGTPNPGLIGPQLWQTIAMQTSNSGLYPQLQQLGQVTGINIVQQIPLPFGIGFVMTAQHQNGQSNWQFAIGQTSGRIEYAGFNVQPSAGGGGTDTGGGAGGGTGGTGGDGGSTPPDGSDPIPPSQACDQFPDLC